ncbi:MAG TPA: peptide chain release factor N(5)-glutamine methyltransferase [Ktedonobacterales bacterium]|jgi:release factor glutamine methyltransferase|nr:peptide chain release factor N(5)-glutamine methyltransferase [Ktedonobacterales bacterium]
MDTLPNDQLNALAMAQTLGEALRLAKARLRASATATPDLDARVLLAHVVGMSPAIVLAGSDRMLAPAHATRYAALVRRRIAGEPVAYLTEHREFMGLDFRTDARALIPRPETELLVEAALEDIRARLQQDPESPPLVADIGTGSGAIAVAIAALESRLPRIYATDISPEALTLSRENAAQLGVADRIVFLQGNLLDPLPEAVDVLLGNLPYVAPRDASILPPDVRLYEPHLALYSQEQGLAHILRLLAASSAHLHPNATLILEFGYNQRDTVEAMARSMFPHGHIDVGLDYAGWDRFIAIRTSAQETASAT